MRRAIHVILATFAAASWLSVNPAHAQGRAAHAPKQTPAATESHATKSSTTKPKTPMTVAQRIDAHPQLVSRLQPLVPAGMTLDQASQGFKNEGRFIAALHVAHNLNIPFDKLKAEMTGTDHDRLGQAIHDLKPAANAKAEARKANAEAREDLKATSKKPNP